MAWYLVKHGDKFTFILMQLRSLRTSAYFLLNYTNK